MKTAEFKYLLLYLLYKRAIHQQSISAVSQSRRRTSDLTFSSKI